MDLRLAQSLCNCLMEKHGVTQHGFKFKWINSSKSFGCCITNNLKKIRTIALSKKLVSLNEMDEVRNTILHEIAHALDYIRNNYKWRSTETGRSLDHDSVWKEICLEIGADPEARYSHKVVNVPLPKYAIVNRRSNKIVRSYYRKPNLPWLDEKKYTIIKVSEENQEWVKKCLTSQGQ